VEAVFKTDEPLVVNGARGLSINLFPPTVAVPGEPYVVPFTLRNDSDITFNMVEFTLAGGPLRLPDGDGEYVYVYNDSPVRYAFATGDNQEEIPIVFSGDSIFVKELHPGEYITAVFIATFPYNEEVWYYRLIESFSTELAGSTVSIPVHISPEWVDPPHIPGEWWNILEFAIGFVGYVIDTVNVIAMIRNIWPTIEAMIELARELLAGNITAADFAIMLFKASFDDIFWMIDNAHMFLNFFDLTREQARELGRRSAGVIYEVMTVALIVYGAAKAAVNATRWLSQKVRAFSFSRRGTIIEPNSREVVIGKLYYNGVSYVDVAQNRNATHFNVSPETWANWERIMGSEDNMWLINEQFMRKQLAEGRTFILSHDPSTATGFFLREVSFLRDRGFIFVPVPNDGVWRAVLNVSTNSIFMPNRNPELSAA